MDRAMPMGDPTHRPYTKATEPTMFIGNPIEAFNLSPEQAKNFAEKLSIAAAKREDSYNPVRCIYELTMFEAADGDPNVAYALLSSWNESMSFITAQGFNLPNKA